MAEGKINTHAIRMAKTVCASRGHHSEYAGKEYEVMDSSLAALQVIFVEYEYMEPDWTTLWSIDVSWNLRLRCSKVRGDKC